MTVKERIGDEYLEWKKGEVITITAGTGKGKSHFVKNELYEKAKLENEKILFFIHRANTKKQFEKELKLEGKQDCITYMTYQSFQHDLLNDCNIDLSIYKYIVCDEYHYFSNDSSYNKFTDLALRAIISCKSESILIFMSATNGFILEYLENHMNITMKYYTIPVEYKFISTHEFYSKDSELQKLLDIQLERKSKTIVFIDSAKRCYQLYERYKENSMFVCSDGNKTYSKKMDKTKRDELIKNNKFSDIFLFTTNTLDAGLSINDDELDSIVLDIADTDTLIQCIGRKRLSEKSNIVKLLIRNRNKGILNDDFKKVTKQLIHVDYLTAYGQEKYSKKYYREPDPTQIVYYEINDKGLFELKINQIAYNYLMHRKDVIKHIKTLRNGYMEYIDKLFNNDTDSFLHDRYLDVDTSDILTKYYNEKIILQYNEKKVFAEKLNLLRGKSYAKTITTINKELDGKKTSYRLVEVDNREKGKGDRRAWTVKAYNKMPDGSYKLI